MSGPQEGDVIQGGTWDGFTLISRYTRTQAIEDGELVDVSETAKEAGFKVPVAVTTGVWTLIEPTQAELEMCQSAEGRLWDVLWLAFLAIKGLAGEKPELLYELLFQIKGRDGERAGMRKFRLKIHSDPGDDGEHVLTVMLPHED